MSVKLHPNWDGWWVIDISPHGRKGKRERINFEGSEVDAILAESNILKAARGGPKIAPKLNELLPVFLEDYKNKKRPLTVIDFMYSWHELSKDFGDMRTSHITALHIDKFIHRRIDKDRVKKRTVNKNISYFSSLLKYLVSRQLTPPLGFKLEGFPVSQTIPDLPDILTMQEIAAVIQHAQTQDIRLIMLLMYLCGLRAGELPTVCVEKIYFERGQIIVTGKGDKERIIPIPTADLAQELAEQMEKVISGPLFMNKRTNKPLQSVRKSIKSAAEAAGINKRMYHHLFRHTFGTHSIKAGTNARILQEILGHVSMNTTNKYIHLAGDDLVQEGCKLGAMVGTGLSRPIKEKEIDLESMVWELPLTHIAKQLKISDVAVKKRCTRLGIKLPPRGYWQRNKTTDATT